MNKIMMKARAGVTLVELLVVILIVTILSVSMLPLLQPFVTEAQYAAEAIPVIGNLRTKIGLYQYDKGQLPAYGNNTDVQTWVSGQAGTSGGANITADSEKFVFASYVLGAGASKAQVKPVTDPNLSSTHIGLLCDIDYQDLKGKRSKPSHYQYYVISASNNYAYVMACFGDGNGLKAGTGYAVCEINFTGAQKKYIGTWKRYKPIGDDTSAIQFGTSAPAATAANEKLTYCYIPAAANWQSFVSSANSNSGEPPLITTMKKAGWEF